MSLKIEFDPVAHRYTVDGEVWPSVTQVLAPLNDFSRVPPAILERARAFGKAAHAMIDLEVKGDLDEDLLGEPLRNVLAQYRFAMRGRKWELRSEQIVAHPALRYAGTLDLIATDSKGRWTIIDVKTGAVPPTVGAQTMAYTQAWCAMQTPPLNPLGRFASQNICGPRLRHLVCKRACLALTETSYKWHSLNDPSDLSIFVSALNLYHFKETHYGHAKSAA